MAKETNDKVMAAVEAALKKNPDASVDELYTLATGIGKDVAKLSKRQFHARYPLQIKRRMNTGKRPKRKAGGAPKRPGRRSRRATQNGSQRDAVRTILLEFASELAAAEARKDVVGVVASVDRWVDRILEQKN